MLLPIGDQPNPRGVPVVNLSLIALNVAIFAVITLPLSMQQVDPQTPGLIEYLRLVQGETGVDIRLLYQNLTAYDLFVFQYGFRPAEGSLTTLFTCMFLHGGWAHLLGNMLFLWIFGDNVEHRLGRLGYLAAYLATGVAATLAHALFRMDSMLPMLGASGAISGVLGFYFLWFPRNEVRLFMWLYFYIDVFLVPARWVLGFYLLVDNLLPFLFSGDAGGVAHSAHIGGFFAGVAGASLLVQWQEWGRVRPWFDAEDDDEGIVLEEAVDRRVIGSAELVRAAMSRGQYAQAVRMYMLSPFGERTFLTAPEIIALGDWLTEEQKPGDALVLFRQFLASHPGDPHAAAVHIRAGLILFYHMAHPTDAYQHLSLALQLDPPPQLAAQAIQALKEIEALQKFQVRRRRPSWP